MTMPQIEALRLPAYNQVMHEISRTDHVQPLTKWQRIVAALA
jgi:hypothetical protein